MSQTVSSRLLCLTRSTLKVVVGMAVAASSGRGSWSFWRHQDSPLRSSTPSSRLPDTTVVSARNSAVVSALKRFWCSLRKVAVFNDRFCFQIWSGTLVADRACKLLLGTPQQLGKASSHSSEGTFVHVCITVGQIRWSLSVTLFLRESQITLVAFSLR